MQVTKIEELGGDNRELRQRVDAMFERKKALKVVQRVLLDEYEVKLSVNSICKYHKKWAAELERIQDEKCHYKAIAQTIGEDGLDVAAAAKLWEAIKVMKPEHLLKLCQVGQERDKLKLAAEELKNRSTELEMKLEDTRREKRREKREVAKAVEAARPEVVVQRVRAIFGLGPRMPLAPSGQLAAASPPPSP